MKQTTSKVFALRVAVILAATAVPARAGILVLDSSNLSQNIVSAMENVAQTAKQIQQYQTQLRQYQNMLQNSTAPKQQIWDAATTTMSQLRGSIDTLGYYRTSLGSIDAYLDKTKDMDTYRASPCYSTRGCTPGELAAMKESERFRSQSQKKANDALFRGLDRQQSALQADASQLERLQSAAQGSAGQLEAIGYANQLASQQANQLLQIRGLLIAQQNVMASRNQALADREAMESAASEAARAGTFARTPAKTY